MAWAPNRELTFEQVVANEKEAFLRVGANDLRMKAKLRARSSGKIFEAPRRDTVLDRDIFQEIQRCMRAGALVQFGHRSGPLVSRLPSPMLQSSWKRRALDDKKERRRLKPTDIWKKSLWLPHPDHTGDMLKALSWGCAMSGAGARSLTLHLAPEVVAAAHADPHGFVRHIHKRMAKELKAALCPLEGAEIPEFFFTVEDTDLGVPHIHGAIFVNEDDERVLPLVRKALKRAGGDCRYTDSGRQLHMPPLETPVRWVNYLSKWIAGSALRHDGGHFAATNGIRKRGREWYQQARSGKVILDPHHSWKEFGSILL